MFKFLANLIKEISGQTKYFVAGLIFFILFSSSNAQVNNPAYANYFLVGQFGEVCTMCEVIVLCNKDKNQAPLDSLTDSSDFTVYYFQTRTFWSQISTIWEWFITNFEQDSLARSGHSRPVTIFNIRNGEWSSPELGEAHLSLDPAIISIGARYIDRIERRWININDDQVEGFCHRMPLWESLELIDKSTEEVGVQ
ncbi:MAG: hypothetical protein VYA80_02185 [Pseudomonadota bacterium]|nr:hypothetical protein [Pseudomonadota bacterium]